MFEPRKEYQRINYWDERSTALLNQNLSFSDKLNKYIIERKTVLANKLIVKYQPKTVCDAGSGSGAVLIPLAVKYPRIHFYAVDFSQKNLNQLISLNIANINVCRADVWKLPFSYHEIDLLFSFDVLYHLTLEQKKMALNEFYRVAKENYVNFRGEEITVLFHYEFLFRKLRLPRFLRDKLTIYYTKKKEK